MADQGTTQNQILSILQNRPIGATSLISALFAVVAYVGAVQSQSVRDVVAPLTVTATNTLSALPQPYNGGSCRLNVNGDVLTDKDAVPSFSVAVGGTAVTWIPANAGYALPVGMPVTSDCTY